jgi:hypothetical protein
MCFPAIGIKTGLDITRVRVTRQPTSSFHIYEKALISSNIRLSWRIPEIFQTGYAPEFTSHLEEIRVKVAE